MSSTAAKAAKAVKSDRAAQAAGFAEFCFPCMHVVEQIRLVRHVSGRGADWIFTCGSGDHFGPDDWSYVHTVHLLDADETIRELADLEPDGQAARPHARSPWLRLTL